AFDTLQPSQQLAMIAEVTRALRVHAVPYQPHTAHNEATIAAIFEMLKVLVDCDIFEKTTTVQKLILKACRETGAGEPLPSLGCKNEKTWHGLIDGLSTLILWDADYEMGHIFLDHARNTRDELLTVTQVDEDY